MEEWDELGNVTAQWWVLMNVSMLFARLGEDRPAALLTGAVLGTEDRTYMLLGDGFLDADVDGTQIGYVTNGTGPPLVLVHGARVPDGCGAPLPRDGGCRAAPADGSAAR
jgi:hypothetical protein